MKNPMHTHVNLDPISGETSSRRSHLRVTGTALATLLLVLSGPPAFAATDDHHATVAGIPTPLAVAAGAVILVLVILLVVTALTRHRDETNDPARPEKRSR